MVDFASDIQEVISKLSRGGSDGGTEDASNNEDAASILESIKDLTDGENVRAAKKLAESLNVAATQCADKSIEMADLMESGLDQLPEMVQTAILEGTGEDDDEPNESDLAMLKTLDRDIEDVQTCVTAIRDLNLSTALSVGLQAFTALSDKAKISQAMFNSIRGFASDVNEVTSALTEMDVVTVAARGKDVLRCIRLSETVKLIAEGVKKLIQVIIDLFEMTAERISTLFEALAFAKDCMMESLDHVKVAKELTADATSKSTALITKSRSVRDQLEEVGAINVSSIRTVKQLVQSGEIQDAIELAQNMDDMVVECSTRVVSMVDRVTEGFKNIPNILLEGVDLEQQGKDEKDPAPADVEDDIVDLEESKRAIEEADVITATRAGVKGFAGVSDKTAVCKNMLEIVQEFAVSCDSTIHAFTSNWNLDSAAHKITEMCRLVNLGEMMKQFAGQIKRLLLVIVALLKAAIEKFSNLDIKEMIGDLGDVKDDVKDAVDNVKDDVKDAVDDAVDAVTDKLKGKLKFWKN